MTDKEAMKLALEWFKCYADKSMSRNNAEALAGEVVDAIEKALKEHAMRETQRLGQEIEQEPVAQVLRKALAWGKVYGAELSGEQWDEMREEMVAQFSIRITPPQRTEQLKACVYCGQLVVKEKNT